MQVPEVLHEIAESEPGEWEFIEVPHEEKDVWRYSFDTGFRIEAHAPMENQEEYEPDWAEDLLGDSRLKRYFYIYHGSTPIRRFVVSVVANGNVQMPPPSSTDRTLGKLEYKIAQILTNDHTRLESVIRQANIDVTDELI